MGGTLQEAGRDTGLWTDGLWVARRDVPTDPVHVLDLALFLPATCAAGALLLRRRGMGYAAAPSALVWLGMISLPILVTPFVVLGRGVCRSGTS